MEKNISNELFNSELIKVNSVEKAFNYVDSVYLSDKLPVFDTVKYIQIVSKFTKERFYYGLTHYSLRDNWITYLSGKLLWSHFSAIVDPNDILKYPEGLCSQQTIVFMELLKKKNINVRSIGMGYSAGPGHFLAEVNYNGSWHLYDVTKEPAWTKLVNHHHQSMKYYIANKDSLYLVYQDKYDRQSFDKLTEKVSYGVVNEYPARNMLLFHRITLMITYLLPLFLLVMIVYLYKYK